MSISRTYDGKRNHLTSTMQAGGDISECQREGLHSFLGLTGCYRKFVKNYATLMAGLIDLTKNNQPNEVQWTDQEQNAFDALKQCLTTGLLLQGPDHNKPCILHDRHFG